MIRSLILGNLNDLEFYSGLITASKYFGEFTALPLNADDTLPPNLPSNHFDAILIISQTIDCVPFLSEYVKKKANIYFTDQQNISVRDLNLLMKLHQESGNLFFPEVPELQHPLVEDFVSTQGSHLMFRYNKTVPGKKHIRQAILSALCFLSILSPMQVKNININNLETSDNNKPMIKIRLKMFDSSIAYIILRLENKTEHNIMMETRNGSFTFNFDDNYLENIHGKRFTSTPTTYEELVAKSLENFALHIILNNSPQFTLHHYTLAVNTLTKIENILKNSF